MVVIPDEYFEVESCVYKLYYGEYYAIIKGKTLSGSIYLFERGYAAYIAAGGGRGNKHAGKGQEEWEGKNSFYYKFYETIYYNPGLPFTVEVLLESNDGYQLLKTEEQELAKSIKDKKCLNSNITAYIPKFRAKTNSYGWLTNRQVADFRRFLAS